MRLNDLSLPLLLSLPLPLPPTLLLVLALSLSHSLSPTLILSHYSPLGHIHVSVCVYVPPPVHSVSYE